MLKWLNDLAEKEKLHKDLVKRVEELERTIDKKDEELARAYNDLTKYEKQFDAMQMVADTTPVNCIRGEWCKACEFSRVFHVERGWPHRRYTAEIVLCGKGESCKNFVERRTKDDV